MLNRPRILLFSAIFGAALVMLALARLSVYAQQTPVPATPAFTDSPFDFNIEPTIDFDPSTPTAPPALSGAYGRAVRGAVSIRSGPGIEFDRISYLPNGQSIDIIGYNGYDLNRPCTANFAADLDMWVYVQRGELRGWMARCALDIGGEFNLANMLINAPPAGSNPPRGLPTLTPISGTPTPYVLMDSFGTRYVIPPTYATTPP